MHLLSVIYLRGAIIELEQNKCVSHLPLPGLCHVIDSIVSVLERHGH